MPIWLPSVFTTVNGLISLTLTGSPLSPDGSSCCRNLGRLTRLQHLNTGCLDWRHLAKAGLGNCTCLESIILGHPSYISSTLGAEVFEVLGQLPRLTSTRLFDLGSVAGVGRLRALTELNLSLMLRHGADGEDLLSSFSLLTNLRQLELCIERVEGHEQHHHPPHHHQQEGGPHEVPGVGLSVLAGLPALRDLSVSTISKRGTEINVRRDLDELTQITKLAIRAGAYGIEMRLEEAVPMGLSGLKCLELEYYGACLTCGGADGVNGCGDGTGDSSSSKDGGGGGSSSEHGSRCSGQCGSSGRSDDSSRRCDGSPSISIGAPQPAPSPPAALASLTRMHARIGSGAAALLAPGLLPPARLLVLSLRADDPEDGSTAAAALLSAAAPPPALACVTSLELRLLLRASDWVVPRWLIGRSNLGSRYEGACGMMPAGGCGGREVAETRSECGFGSYSKSRGHDGAAESTPAGGGGDNQAAETQSGCGFDVRVVRLPAIVGSLGDVRARVLREVTGLEALARRGVEEIRIEYAVKEALTAAAAVCGGSEAAGAAGVGVHGGGPEGGDVEVGAAAGGDARAFLRDWGHLITVVER